MTQAIPGPPGFERWTPPDFSDLAAVARVLEAACPDAAPVAPLRVLGEGFFSVAVATASGMVFRLGTSPDVFARYRKEWRVLPWLMAQSLPLEVPGPRWLLEPDDSFPFGGTGYPLIEGRTLTEADVTGPHRARFAEQIAAFSLAVHRLPVAQAYALGVPDGRTVARAWHEEDRAISTVALEAVLTADEQATVARWWDGFFTAFKARAYAPVMTHGDLGDENLIVSVDGTRLVAAIDWEHCAAGDPLDDFRHLQDLGRDFLDETLAAYRRLGGPALGDVEAWWAWSRQRGAFPSIRRTWQRGERIDAEAVRNRLRRYGVLP
jgi:aminoglycoside phosphotransferase (APT) family kinase protein